MPHAPITALTPAEQRVADQLVGGLNARAIAAEMHLSPNTVSAYLRATRAKLHCPPRCATHVLAHRLLSTQQVPAPAPAGPPPDLDPRQQRLLNALAEHTSSYDIALAAQLAPADVRPAVEDLLAGTGADDTTQLVVQGHAWGLLGTVAKSDVPEVVSQ
ncbi:helix-turn-helix transcriptional regulator [Streptomyces sp. NPDC047968]|uniref:helix-turn-helix domain-containing protein n=1 Tax=unclassified Streptomyces TaxID=2593676 RepID=UPI0034418F77